MTEVKTKLSPRVAGPMPLTFADSSRLRSLSQNSPTTSGQNLTPPKTAVTPVMEDAETANLRRLIAQKLAEIVANLPAGKQHSLFKIRYRIELDQIDNMPVTEVAEILNIKLPRR